MCLFIPKSCWYNEYVNSWQTFSKLLKVRVLWFSGCRMQRAEALFVTYDLWKWLPTVSRGALRHFWVLVKIWEPQGPPHGAPRPPHGAPGPQTRGLPLKIRSGAPAHLLWLISKPFLEVPVMFLIVVKIWEPTVPPMEPPWSPYRGLPLKNPLRHPCLLWLISKPFF